MERVRIPLSPEEYRALSRLSDAEFRPIDQQARRAVVDALRSAGYLSPTPQDREAGPERES
ncbi:MAG: hypothetical protein DCC58_05110 [Chloroflexi bacterium]|nr:MAG: hypothetical protein DCC58_05110 [Chloroflexota bacterium]